MKNKILKALFITIIITSFLSSCNDDVLPKPTAFLRLEYPNDSYSLTKTIPYEFETPKNSKILINSKYWMKIKYPKLKASIEITYRPVENNINELLLEAEKLTLTHAKKADEIYYDTYKNELNKVYGKLSNVTGNAASPLQFYLTDSTKHFLTGAIYFNVQPNYDSIYPAIKYIEKDVKHLINTTAWH